MTTQLAPDRLALPPPLDVDLVDANRATGWIGGNAVGFRGFGDETEASHAAWVAHRTLARRLARTHGLRPIPVDIEPLALQRVDGKEMILASGQPFATLIRPGSDSRTGDSFGFELQIPTPTTELQVRAMAYLMYRTLRKSGIRWAMWRRAARPFGETATSVGTVTEPIEHSGATRSSVDDRPMGSRWRPRARSTRRSSAGVTKVALRVLPVTAAAVLVVSVAQLATASLTALLLAGMGAGALMLLRIRGVR